MKKFWLVIEGPPGRQFATDRSLLPFLDMALSKDFNLISVGTIRSAADDSGENVNVDCILDNDGGQLSAYWIARSPLGSHAKLYSVDTGTEAVELVFQGTVYGGGLGQQAVASLQA